MLFRIWEIARGRYNDRVLDCWLGRFARWERAEIRVECSLDLTFWATDSVGSGRKEIGSKSAGEVWSPLAIAL